MSASAIPSVRERPRDDVEDLDVFELKQHPPACRWRAGLSHVTCRLSRKHRHRLRVVVEPVREQENAGLSQRDIRKAFVRRGARPSAMVNGPVVQRGR